MEPIIRKALPSDAMYVVPLIMQSANDYFNYIYTCEAPEIMKNLFLRANAIFSYNFCHVALIHNQVGGIVITFDNRELYRSLGNFTWVVFRSLGLLKFLSFIPRLLKSTLKVGNFAKQEYYLSNIAVSSQFQRNGVATRLLDLADSIAKQKGFSKIVLDVEAEKESAINLYRKNNYQFNCTLTLDYQSKRFVFNRMEKYLD